MPIKILIFEISVARATRIGYFEAPGKKMFLH